MIFVSFEFSIDLYVCCLGVMTLKTERDNYPYMRNISNFKP